MTSAPKLKVLELFCGVGGMHWSLKESLLDFEVKCAVDINTVTNSIYQHNFPGQVLAQREIQSLSAKELNKLEIDTLLMSPPCQPFTRVGLKKDIEDQRTNAFLAVLEMLERLSTPISYVLVENVKGFEDSHTRDEFIKTLAKNNYIYQEFMLTPLQFGIPNSRLRYYCIAKHRSKGDNFSFSHSTKVFYQIPEEARCFLLHKHKYIDSTVDPESIRAKNRQGDELTNEQVTSVIDSDDRIATVSEYLDSSSPANADFVLDEKAMRHYEGLDIRKPTSRNTCCFTKRYGHYYVGSGSFLSTGRHVDADIPELRYFTPSEVARLMSFPPQFTFPDSVTRKQKYRALGNSLNVYVVSNLIRLMVCV